VTLSGGALSSATAPIFGGRLLGAWPPALQPFLDPRAAWTVPIAVATMVSVSRTDRRRVPNRADAFLARLRTPDV